MVRTSFLMIVAVAVCFISSTANAVEPNGNVDQSALAAMGLANLEVMTDTEGEEVRGSFASAWGGSGLLGRVLGGSGYSAHGPNGAGGSATTQRGIGVNLLGLPISVTTYSSHSSAAYAY